MELPPFLREDLQRLPPYCGVAWWVRGSEKIPVFVLAVPSPFQPAAFSDCRIQFLPARLYTFPAAGSVLDLSLHMSSPTSLALTISLVLNLGDEDQRPFFERLTGTYRIELLLYDSDTYDFIGTLRADWPEMHRHKMRELIQTSTPARDWWEAIMRWIQEVYGLRREGPLVAPDSSKKEPSAVVTEYHQPSSLSSVSHNLGAASSSSFPVHAHGSLPQLPDSKPFPTRLLPAFQNVPPLSGLLWHLDSQRVPCCLIKIPQGNHFPHLSVVFDRPREPYGEGRKEAAIALSFRIQTAPGRPQVSKTSVFYLSSSDDWELLKQLTQASRIQLLSYSHDATPKYLGSKPLEWSDARRKALRQLILRSRPNTVFSDRAEDALLRRNPQVQEEARWKPSSDTASKLSSPLMRAHITLANEPEALPRMYVKVPKGTRFEEVAVAFGPLNLSLYAKRGVLSLTLMLQDTARRVMKVDCLFDPINARHILQRLTTTPMVEMVALADVSALPILGAKLLNWPQAKKDRATLLSHYSWALSQKGSWKRACAQYLAEHQQGYVFQISFPEAMPSPAAAGQPETFDRSRSSQHQATLFHDPSPQEQIKAPVPQTTPAPATAQTKSASSALLVEKCVLLHRAGVREEYARTHTLTKRMFWRMLLALALEKTQRKFIWTPEAAQVVEEHRKQLTPGATAPWLSSREHVWIEFTEPWETPACPDTAALFVFSAWDPSLLSEFARQVRISSHDLKTLERTLYLPEQRQVTFNIVNHVGAIVWAISLHMDTHSQQRGVQGAWSMPVWSRCPSKQCQLHTGEASALCETCAATRTFVWTWLSAAWQSLSGLYRAKSREGGFLETVGEEHIEHITRPLSERSGSNARNSIDIEYRYRVMRHIDIADAPVLLEPKGTGQRGSWVEVLASIDPALVFYDEREIPLRTRTLKHPRYANYIRQHGTNQIEVRAHSKHVPMRADPKAMTRVTAKRQEKEGKEE